MASVDDLAMLPGVTQHVMFCGRNWHEVNTSDNKEHHQWGCMTCYWSPDWTYELHSVDKPWGSQSKHSCLYVMQDWYYQHPTTFGYKKLWCVKIQRPQLDARTFRCQWKCHVAGTTGGDQVEVGWSQINEELISPTFSLYFVNKQGWSEINEDSGIKIQ